MVREVRHRVASREDDPDGQDHSGMVASEMLSARLGGGIRRPGMQADPSTSDTQDRARHEPDARVGSRSGSWPYAAPETAPLPATLPDGAPWPRISVVTPSYNHGAYIEETILSVLNQGYPDVELIVVDGASADATGAVLEAYRERIAHVISEPDKGQSDALNKGFRLATGTILTWLNSDDMLAPGALVAMAMAFATSDADMVAGICVLRKDGKVIDQPLTSCAKGTLPLDDLLDIEGSWMEGQFFYQPEVFYTRELFDRAGGHISDWYYSMDYELWLRFAEQGAKLHVIGRPICWFRVIEGQKSGGDEFKKELPKVREAYLTRTGRPAPARASERTRRRLDIVMFSDLGYLYGAGIGQRRIAEALEASGHKVHEVGISEHPRRRSSERRIAQALARVRAHEPDLVIVGNLHGAGAGADVVRRLSEEVETAFILHDLWFLTGRCAYPGSCTRYLTGCDDTCTCEGEYPRRPSIGLQRAWEEKRALFRSERPLTWIANSDWTRDSVLEALSQDGGGAYPGAPPPRLQFGISTEEFRPRDKALCRELLGLPQDRFVIMCSGSSVLDPRKGVQHLADAIELLDLPDTLVVAMGSVSKKDPRPIPGMKALGYIWNRYQLPLVFGAADIFVGPSLEEAYGQVFLEAAACGIPSVGYPVGGVPESIRHGVTGIVTEAVGPTHLAAAIERLYHDPQYRRDLGRWARIYAENEFSTEISAHSLMRIFTEAGITERLSMPKRVRIRVPPPPKKKDENLLHRLGVRTPRRYRSPKRLRDHMRRWRRSIRKRMPGARRRR